jgi:hypothetical protein
MHTADRSPIGNWQDTALDNPRIPEMIEKGVKPPATIRVRHHVRYNCHGLTFGSRRASVLNSSIGTIIADDSYNEVEEEDVRPGDCVIYRSDQGEAQHSGIVLSIDPSGTPLVLSKWGVGGPEVFHPLRKGLPASYPLNDIRFFRIGTVP